MKKMMFEGLPVREAKRAIRIIPTNADKKRAKRGDPACCVAAMCLKRTHMLADVRVYRSRILSQPAGKKYWLRHEAPAGLSEEIRIFDATGEFTGKEFLCKPLSPSRRLPHRVVYDKTRTDKVRKAKSSKKTLRQRHVSPMSKLRGRPKFEQIAA